MLKNNKIKAYGFQALKDYASNSHKYGMPVIVSSLSPAIMAEMGIMEYYALVLPRGTVLTSAQDVFNADLNVNKIIVQWEDREEDIEEIIVSRHNGTIEILKEMYPNATVFKGNINPEDINGKFVIGTLPPHLIQYAYAYQAVTINNFDYCKDKDLTGKELQERIHISRPISVLVYEKKYKTIEFERTSKITEEEKKEIIKIIDNIYERNKHKIENYIKYNNILKECYVDCYNNSCVGVADIIKKINNVYKVTGRDEPLKEMGDILEAETLNAQNYIHSHDRERYIIKLHDDWHNFEKLDCQKDFSERMDCIHDLNLTYEYFPDIIGENDIKLLSQYISIKNRR